MSILLLIEKTHCFFKTFYKVIISAMSSMYDFSKMNELYSAKKYNEALIYFKSNKTSFSQQEITGNIYLISDIINCLRHISAFDASFKFMNIYGINIDNDTPERVLNAYAWLLYDNFKAENNNNDFEELNTKLEIKEIESAVETITIKQSVLIQLIKEVVLLLQKSESTYMTTVLENLFKLVLKVEFKRPNPNWTFVIEFCDSVQPERLTKQSKIIQITNKGKIKEMELASLNEEWYVHISKALFQTKQYSRCLDISKRALESCGKFHYSNDIWFARRIALCLKNMGNTQEGIVCLEKLLIKKCEWFILKELSEFYFENGNEEKALSYAREGMCAYGSISYKVELVEELGNMILNKGDKELALKHYLFAKLLREKEKWYIDNVLLNKIKTLENECSSLAIEKKELEKELEIYWDISKPINCRNDRNINYGKNQDCKITGSITKLLKAKDSGIDGFVRNDNGGSVYFFVSKDHKIFNELKIGLHIDYETIAALNGKGDKAINLRLI